MGVLALGHAGEPGRSSHTVGDGTNVASRKADDAPRVLSPVSSASQRGASLMK